MNFPTIKINRDRQVPTVDLDHLPADMSLDECNRLLPIGQSQLDESGILIVVLYRTPAESHSPVLPVSHDNYHYTTGYYSA